MANMSYCRFENTYSDLDDCYEALERKTLDELSDSERAYALHLIKLCAKIEHVFGDYIED